jgi:predicted PurR-regulated permease PerM
VVAAFLRALFGGVDNAFRPLAEKGALLFSLLTILVGLVANGWQWGVLGIAVGVPGVVLPYVARRLEWTAARMWLLVGIVVVVDFGVMSAVAGAPGT